MDGYKQQMRWRKREERMFPGLPDWVTITLLLGFLFVVLPLFLAIVVFGPELRFSVMMDIRWMRRLVPRRFPW